MSPTPPRPLEACVSAALLGLLVLAFTALQTRLAAWKSAGLTAEWGFDVTFFHNLVWNVAQGNGYQQSASYHEPPGIFAETHLEPILLLAVPAYKVVPGLVTLYAVQSFLIALTAVGIYRLVRSTPARPAVALAGAAAFLLWWPAWRMAQADIRPLLWSMPFLVLTLAALRDARRWEALTWALLACLSREELPVMVAFAALGAATWRTPPARWRRWIVASLVVACGLYFVGTTVLRSNSTFYIQPRVWLESLLSEGNDDSQWGHAPADLLAVRLRYLGEWLLPAGIGAVLAPEALLGAVPLFVYLFSQSHEWATWEGPYIHHAAPAAALVAAAAALGWGRVARWLELPAPVIAILLLGLLGAEARVLQDRWERVIAPELEPWRTQEPRVLEAHRLAALVPPDASVMADWDTVHLFSGRAQVYCYYQEEPEDLFVPADGRLDEPLIPRAGLTPDWALIDREDERWLLRAAAAGLVERGGGEEWVLLGPPGGGRRD